MRVYEYLEMKLWNNAAALYLIGQWYVSTKVNTSEVPWPQLDWIPRGYQKTDDGVSLNEEEDVRYSGLVRLL